MVGSLMGWTYIKEPFMPSVKSKVMGSFVFNK